MKLPKRLIILLLIVPFLVGILYVIYSTDYQPKSNIFLPWQQKTLPTLKLRAVPRYPEGVRIYIEADHFKMSDIMTKKEAKRAHGHVHLYINDKLHSMVSGSMVDISLEAFNKKENEILVTLQSADHRFITIDGQPVFKRIWLNGSGQEFQYRGKEHDKDRLPDMLHKSINEY